MRGMLRLLLGVLVMPVVIAGLDVFLGGRSMTSAVLWNVMLWIPISIASMLAHELAHAGVGALLGLKVRRIIVGTGPQLFKRRMGGVVFVWNSLPLLGLTMLAVDRPKPLLRARLWLAVAAGPLMSGILVALFDSNHTPFVSTVSVGEVAFYVNASFFVFSALPFRFFGGVQRSDGLQLLSLPFLPRERFEEFVLSSSWYDVHDALEEHDLSRAEVALANLKALPSSRVVRTAEAAIALERGEYARARTVYVELLADDPEPGFALVLQNNLTWVSFRERDPARLEEADRSSSQLLTDAKRASFALGTRGAVLLWKGELVEACELLEQAQARQSFAGSRAFNAACLAMAWARRGDAQRAEEWLAVARHADPRCNLLPEAEADVRERASPVASSE